MFKSIADTAKELNVSKQCIYKKLSTFKDELKGCVKVENGSKLISLDGIEKIKNTLVDSTLNQKNIDNTDSFNAKLLNQYENRIKQLENTIENMKNQYESEVKYLRTESDNKTELLRNMQILLKEQKLLESKTWWKFWK